MANIRAKYWNIQDLERRKKIGNTFFAYRVEIVRKVLC